MVSFTNSLNSLRLGDYENDARQAEKHKQAKMTIMSESLFTKAENSDMENAGKYDDAGNCIYGKRRQIVQVENVIISFHSLTVGIFIQKRQFYQLLHL
jgi:hypothetical protein